MKTKRENIAEYVLYMWQMEDVVRAFQTDEAMQRNQFLSNLEAMMRQEGVMEHGHTQLALNAVAEVEELHQQLLEEEATYRAQMLQLKPQLNILKSKSDNPTQTDIEMMFVFLYNIMLLRLQKKSISAETQTLQLQVSHLLAYLSKTYKTQKDDNEAEV